MPADAWLWQRLEGLAMVTALSSTRLIAAQLALKVLTADDTSSDSSDSSLLDGSSVGKNVSSLPSSAQASLASMLNSLSNNQSGSTTTTDSSNTTAASTDITTASFMALLKQNLTATAAGSGDGKKQAQAMLDALKAGTLTISDPTSGVSITAWDPTATSSTDASHTAADAKTNTATTIPTTVWNDYLKAHLSRNADGALARAADNSFIDKSTGNEAYFGQVGTEFYYLTWAAPKTTTTGTPASGTAATDAAGT